MLISISEKLALRMQATIPIGQRSKTIVRLLEKEIEKREKSLYECAMAVENDAALRQEMSDWDITLGDGLENESW